MCLCKFEDTLNVFSHTWHLYGFSPLWILLWTTRSPDVVNRLLQTVHSNGFSPEWLRLCSARHWRFGQHLPSSVHLYLPVWIFIWRHRPPWDEKKRLSQRVHEYTFSPWSVSFTVVIQTLTTCVPLVTHCTQIWPYLVILSMLCDIIITISFNLQLRATHCKLTMQL